MRTWRRVVVAVLVGVAVGVALALLPLKRPRLVLDGGRGVAGLHWSPDSRHLLSVHITGEGAANHGSFHVWDAATGELVGTCEEGRPHYRFFVFSPDGTRLAGRDADNGAAEWDWPSLRLRARYKLEPLSILAYAPDGRLLTSREGTATVVEAATGNVVHRLSPAKGTADYISVTVPGWLFVHRGTQADLIDMKTGAAAGRFRLDGELTFDAGLAGQFITPDGRRLLYYDDPLPSMERVWFWRDGRTGESVRLPWGVDPIALSPDGEHAACVYYPGPESWLRRWVRLADDSGVAVHAMPSGRCRASLPGARPPASFAPDGRALAVANEREQIELWDFPVRKRWNLILGGGLVAGSLALLALTARRAGRGRTGRTAANR